jgi:hypothetical protein
MNTVLHILLMGRKKKIMEILAPRNNSQLFTSQPYFQTMSKTKQSPFFLLFTKRVDFCLGERAIGAELQG